MAERKVVATDGNTATFEITVKDKEKTVTTTFPFCKDAESFPAWLGSLSPKGDGMTQEAVYDLAIYAADLKARAKSRETVAADSTIIKRDGKDIDLMSLPIEKAIAAVNAMHMLATSTGGEMQNAFRVTRERLLAAGKVSDQDGLLVVKQ